MPAKLTSKYAQGSSFVPGIDGLGEGDMWLQEVELVLRAKHHQFTC